MTDPRTEQLLQEALEQHRAGRSLRAEALYRQVLDRQPDHAVAWHQLGLLAYQGGRVELAVASVGRAIQSKPDWAEARCNLGAILLTAGRPQDAAAACSSAIDLEPNLAAAHANLGNALRALRRTEDAVVAFRSAIRLQPDLSALHNNLGVALRETGRLDDAIASGRRAVELDPHVAAAHSNLGAALGDRGLHEESIAACRRAVELDPRLAESHSNLARGLAAVGRLDEAIAAGRRAIELKPHFVDAYVNLSNALKDTGRLDEAIAACRRAIALEPDARAAHDNLLYTLHYHFDYGPEQILDAHRDWARHSVAPVAAVHVNDRTPHRRLKIGYVSPDLRQHPIGELLLPVLTHHDRAAVEAHCYADVRRGDALTQRLRQASDVWHDTTAMSDAALAARVGADGIDVLVDLSMHMAGNRLDVFAHHPAPVQATWLAYPGTTGLPQIRYRLTDPYLDPTGVTDHFYSEQSVRLPDSFWCYDPLTNEPAVGPLPALAGGAGHRFTFGCLNNFCKVTDATLTLWSEVLRTVPRSRLILLAPMGERRRAVLEQLGVHAERVEFVDRLPRPQYLATFNRIDLCLDTLPYNGHTTGLDGLWMGVPAVTLCGWTVVGRGGYSQLSNLGLTEFAAHTPEQYVAIAARAAEDLPRLASVRAGLRARMQTSPLMDAPRFARNLEAAFRQMWTTWCATPTAAAADR